MLVANETTTEIQLVAIVFSPERPKPACPRLLGPEAFDRCGATDCPAAPTGNGGDAVVGTVANACSPSRLPPRLIRGLSGRIIVSQTEGAVRTMRMAEGREM